MAPWKLYKESFNDLAVDPYAITPFSPAGYPLDEPLISAPGYLAMVTRHPPRSVRPGMESSSGFNPWSNVLYELSDENYDQDLGTMIGEGYLKLRIGLPDITLPPLSAGGYIPPYDEFGNYRPNSAFYGELRATLTLQGSGTGALVEVQFNKKGQTADQPWTAQLWTWFGYSEEEWLTTATFAPDLTRPWYRITDDGDGGVILSASVDGLDWSTVAAVPFPVTGSPESPLRHAAHPRFLAENYQYLPTYWPPGTANPGFGWEATFTLDEVEYRYRPVGDPVPPKNATARWNNQRYDLTGRQSGGAARFSLVVR